MKNDKRLFIGLTITLLIFVLSTISGRKIDLGISFLPNSFVIHSVMLILSLVAILTLKKEVSYKINFLKLKKTLRPILFGLIAAIIVNISFAIITKLLGGEIEPHDALTKMSPLQVFIFIFIYASIW